MRSAVLCLALILGASACKGDRQVCDNVCRNAATLLYWRDADAEIAKAPPDKRAALRKKKLGEFDHKLENGVDLCVDQCSSANNDKLNDCMLAAKTADDVDACTK